MGMAFSGGEDEELEDVIDRVTREAKESIKTDNALLQNLLERVQNIEVTNGKILAFLTEHLERHALKRPRT